MYRIAFTMAAIGIATLSLSTPADAGNGSAVNGVCRTPTARLLCATATGLCRATGARICRAGVLCAPGTSMASPLTT